jgi:4-hydroxy-tetrahydrodipicolinate reductase
MGQTILRCIAEMSDIELAGAVTIPADPALGEDAGLAAGVPAFGVVLTDDPRHALDRAQVAIDFTLAPALPGNLAACVASGTALVIGTTGLDQTHFAAIDEAAHEIPLVYARNMSVGVNVFMSLVGIAARALGNGYDVEILEAHHRHKVDAPSGTALGLGQAAARGRGVVLDKVAARGRDGITGERKRGAIGFASLRGGSVTGDHTVTFAGEGERIELTHRAEGRHVFARGAVRAALWAQGKGPGLYGMNDVLGL